MGFSGSYAPDDVTFLLKPIRLETIDVATKEALIQSGARHYSEMLSPEEPPTGAYLALYEDALARNGLRLATDVAALATALDARQSAGRDIILVSLVRAGTPIGILLARALRRKGRKVSHYSISIVRDRGIDPVALRDIMNRHDANDIIFVDGWTGKGAIATELRASLPDAIMPFLVVIADPAGHADLAATHDDYLIASGLLNSVVSGLISRSVLNAEIAASGSYHGCVILEALAPHDKSRTFVDRIDAMCSDAPPIAIDEDARTIARASCQAMVESIMAETGTTNRNLVKPGIAEATRVMLRRRPQRLYIRDLADPDVQHLLHLAEIKHVPIYTFINTSHFRAAALINATDP